MKPFIFYVLNYCFLRSSGDSEKIEKEFKCHDRALRRAKLIEKNPHAKDVSIDKVVQIKRSVYSID